MQEERTQTITISGAKIQLTEENGEVVVTVFFNGTCSNSNDDKNPRYYEESKTTGEKIISGETISVLRKNVEGTEVLNFLKTEAKENPQNFYFGVDGPGSGNLDHQDRLVPPTTYSTAMQIALGYGVTENVAHVLEALRRLKRRGIKIKKTNFGGWSRGAAACITAASLMDADKELCDIDVNIFGIDPVPGVGNATKENLFLTKNVKHACFVYAENEHSAFFSPVFPKAKSPGTHVEYVIMPGHHATLSGNPGWRDPQTDSKLGKVYFPEPGKIVRWMAEQFLMKHGTKFKNTLQYTRQDLLNLYKKIWVDMDKYKVLQQEAYIYPQLFGTSRKVSDDPNSTSTNLQMSQIDILNQQRKFKRKENNHVNSLHTFLESYPDLDPAEFFNPKRKEVSTFEMEEFLNQEIKEEDSKKEKDVNIIMNSEMDAKKLIDSYYGEGAYTYFLEQAEAVAQSLAHNELKKDNTSNGDVSGNVSQQGMDDGSSTTSVPVNAAQAEQQDTENVADDSSPKSEILISANVLQEQPEQVNVEQNPVIKDGKLEVAEREEKKEFSQRINSEDETNKEVPENLITEEQPENKGIYSTKKTLGMKSGAAKQISISDADKKLENKKTNNLNLSTFKAFKLLETRQKTLKDNTSCFFSSKDKKEADEIESFLNNAKKIHTKEGLRNFCSNYIKECTYQWVNLNAIKDENKKKELLAKGGARLKVTTTTEIDVADKNSMERRKEKKVVTEEYINTCPVNYVGLRAFTSTTRGQLIKKLQKELDQLELRELRKYAKKLEDIVGDPIAQKKADAIHKILNCVMDKNTEKALEILMAVKKVADDDRKQEKKNKKDKVKRDGKKEENIANLTYEKVLLLKHIKIDDVDDVSIFNTQRGFFHSEKTTTIKLLEKSIKKLQAKLNKEQTKIIKSASAHF